MSENNSALVKVLYNKEKPQIKINSNVSAIKTEALLCSALVNQAKQLKSSEKDVVDLLKTEFRTELN